MGENAVLLKCLSLGVKTFKYYELMLNTLKNGKRILIFHAQKYRISFTLNTIFQNIYALILIIYIYNSLYNNKTEYRFLKLYFIFKQ